MANDKLYNTRRQAATLSLNPNTTYETSLERAGAPPPTHNLPALKDTSINPGANAERRLSDGQVQVGPLRPTVTDLQEKTPVESIDPTAAAEQASQPSGIARRVSISEFDNVCKDNFNGNDYE